MGCEQLGKVAVLMGGFSSEREVSLSSGSGVLEALKNEGVNAVAFDPARQSISELVAQKFDRVMISLHGRFGEDGVIQGVLEMLQIPYTGPGVMASAIAMDKAMTRVVWQNAGIPVARGIVVHDAGQAAQVIEALGTELVVKPATEGSSIGVTKLAGTTVQALEQALTEALKLDSSVLIEERWYGREFTVAIIDQKALPIIEIKAPEGDYDFKNKYFGNAVHYECPAKLTETQTAQIQSVCEKAFSALGARGWGRIDVMMRPDGSFILLELNTSPGMTPHSLVPMAARQIGLTYGQLCVKIASMATLDHQLSHNAA